MPALSPLTTWPLDAQMPAEWAPRASAASIAANDLAPRDVPRDAPRDANDARIPHADAVPFISTVPAELFMRQPQRRACAYIFIANLPHLAEAYGQDFASSASCEIQRRLCAGFLRTSETDLARLRDDCFLLWANDAFAAADPQAGASMSRELETLLSVLGAEPVRAKGIAAMVQLHADWIEVRPPEQLGAAEIALTLWTAQPFPDSGESRADGWRQRYRADMDVAVRVNEAVLAEGLNFAWQPVVQAGGIATIFYREGRPRIARSRDEPASLTAEVFTPCLQRLGLSRAFDRLAVRRAMEALRLRPSAHIGVGISAQSVKSDHWWASLLSMLDAEPTLASRLVIEINGGTGLPDLEAARDFCMQLQLRGCRIALRDFGAGGDNLAAVQACRPDIVKLDASFLRRARDSAFGRECLRGMLSLCAHFATHVVVDGVEREDDVHVALGAGAQWLQGYSVRGSEPQGPAAAPAVPRQQVDCP
ncbi:EAL domain-containing protein [Variovorax sp. E3]|uniref:EAL domain-containing protein n=1 Tax=Variovorax sp. E3 TaxID=1914993 RepID=UPI0018DDDE62|nr:EAL domain-containing protein [Variovorax sp. E3]